MTKTTTDTNKKLPPPEENIRSDLWPTMSSSQLFHQQELVLDKITKLQSMTPYGAASTPAAEGLLAALQQAMKDLTALIDSKTVQKPRRGVNGQ